jgi:hypothetical protein
MSRRQIFHSWLLILTFSALPVHAADSALDAVSIDASAVIRFKNPKATMARLADLSDAVKKGLGDRVRNAEIGKLISNPDLTGVDMESDWWVAIYAAGGNKEPDVVYLIPAKDIKAMKSALGNGVRFEEHGKFGVYTTDADAVLGLKSGDKSISTLIDKDSNAVFEGGDLSAFINLPQLAAAYKTEIADGKQKLQESLENGQGMPGMNTRQLAETAGPILDFLIQGLNDAQSCTVAGIVSKEGISFEDLVKLRAGTATDKLLAKSPPGALATLLSLPAGYVVYWGLTWNMADFAQLNEWLMGLGGNAIGAERSKELTQLLGEIAKLKIGSMVGAYGLGDPDQGAVRSITVTEADNPQKMRDLSRKIVKSLASAEAQGVKQTFELKPDAEKFGKDSADIVTMKTEMEDDGSNPFAAMQQRMMSVLFGPEGMETRTVYLKDRFVQTVGGGKKQMTEALAAIEKPAEGSKSPPQQARARLGAKNNLVILLDLPNLIAKAASMMLESGQLPLPIDPEDVKALQGKPSFVGLGATTEPQGLRVKTQVPLEQMQGVAKIVDFMQRLFQGAGLGVPDEEPEEN